MVHLLWPLEMDPFASISETDTRFIAVLYVSVEKKEKLTPAHISKVTLNMSSHSAQHCRYQT